MATVHTNETTGSPVEAMLGRPFSVRRKIKETYDTFTLDLVDTKGGEFSFSPGQFNMLYAMGIGEVPISISGDPSRKGVLTHTIRAVGTVTRAMKMLKPGASLWARGPYGTGWPVDRAEGCDVVVVAGGIGLAPLRPVLYHVLTNRDKYGKIILLYGTRTPEDILYRRELEKLRGRFDMDVLITVDRAAGDWRGNIGVVTTLVGRASFDPLHCVALVCGPEIMMRFTLLELLKRGVAEDSIYISMERNMKCGVGLCGHCQLGPTFICKDGPVYRYDRIKNIFTKREM